MSFGTARGGGTLIATPDGVSGAVRRTDMELAGFCNYNNSCYLNDSLQGSNTQVRSYVSEERVASFCTVTALRSGCTFLTVTLVILPVATTYSNAI